MIDATLEKAANEGDAEAQFQLGRAYDLGHKVPDKHDRESGKWTAEKWYQKAAKQGHIEAQYSLGYFYANDFHLKDYKKSAKWYRVAAEQGHVEAQFSLGIYYHHYAGNNSFLKSFLSPIGFLAKSDRIEALKWYRKAAEQGHVQAQFNLGDCYEQAVDDFLPTEWDRAEAVKWYRKAAEHGHANAQYRLGCRYRDGKGAPKNFVEAYKWLNLAWEKFQEKSRRGQELWWDEKSAGEDRDKLAALMTPDQIDEGQRLASEFKPHTEPSATNPN
jgi:TPR repeat protein